MYNQEIWKDIVATAKQKEEDKEGVEQAVAQLRRQKAKLEEQEREIR